MHVGGATSLCLAIQNVCFLTFAACFAVLNKNSLTYLLCLLKTTAHNHLSRLVYDVSISDRPEMVNIKSMI